MSLPTNIYIKNMPTSILKHSLWCGITHPYIYSIWKLENEVKTSEYLELCWKMDQSAVSIILNYPMLDSPSLLFVDIFIHRHTYVWNWGRIDGLLMKNIWNNTSIPEKGKLDFSLIDLVFPSKSTWCVYIRVYRYGSCFFKKKWEGICWWKGR